MRELRHARSLKLYDISAQLRVDPATVDRWERAESPIPDWAKLALAEFYGVKPAYLMGWEREVAA